MTSCRWGTSSSVSSFQSAFLLSALLLAIACGVSAECQQIAKTIDTSGGVTQFSDVFTASQSGTVTFLVTSLPCGGTADMQIRAVAEDGESSGWQSLTVGDQFQNVTLSPSMTNGTAFRIEAQVKQKNSCTTPSFTGTVCYPTVSATPTTATIPTTNASSVSPSQPANATASVPTSGNATVTTSPVANSSQPVTNTTQPFTTVAPAITSTPSARTPLTPTTSPMSDSSSSSSPSSTTTPSDTPSPSSSAASSSAERLSALPWAGSLVMSVGSLFVLTQSLSSWSFA